MNPQLHTFYICVNFHSPLHLKQDTDAVIQQAHVKFSFSTIFHQLVSETALPTNYYILNQLIYINQCVLFNTNCKPGCLFLLWVEDDICLTIIFINLNLFLTLCTYLKLIKYFTMG